MKKWLSVGMVGLISMVLMVAACAPAPAEKGITAEEFYRGANIEFLVTSNPGGTFDTYCRLTVPFLAKELGVNQLIIENMGGATGLIGCNWMYLNAPRDGSLIGLTTGTALVTSEVVGLSPEAQWKSGSEFSLIALYGTTPQFIVAYPELRYNSLQELMGATGLKAGATNLVSTLGTQAAITAECLGMKDMSIVTGFSGVPDLLASVFRGELDLASPPEDQTIKSIEGGLVKLLGIFASERDPNYPDVQSVGEFAAPGTKKWIDIHLGIRGASYYWYGPPGIPEDRLEFVRQAFARMLKNPDYQEAMAERGLGIYTPLIGKEAEALRDNILALPQAEKEGYINITMKYQK
ncbi:Bug family tripartite tricarboxylate transporter substrate binding protein [Chloroflexota bacterium]